MTVTTNLLSTVLMGVFLVAVVGAFARLRANRGGSREMSRSTSDLPRTAANATPATAETEPGVSTGSSATPIGWVIGFLGLVVVVGGGAVAFISGNALLQVGTQTAGGVLAVILGGSLCGYLVSGVYLSLRSHGRKNAEATGVALWMLGLLGIVAIAVQLLFFA